MEKIFKKIKGLLINGALLLISFYVLPATVHAATLYFAPSSGAYAVGDTFTASVYVSSADKTINAASSTIFFPSDKLEVESLSKSGSIFSLWVHEPSFSNSNGTIKFEGIILSPGFTGSGGKVINITFRAKAASDVPLTFHSGSVLANDGKGTNILTGLGNANFSIGQIQSAASKTDVPLSSVAPSATSSASSVAISVPNAPVISSPTHPDSDKWYAESGAKFNWSALRGTTAVSLLVGKIPNAHPTTTYIPPINSKEITNLEDGVWYFSARLKNSAGWGGVSHFQFQIDTEKPVSFNITEAERTDSTYPRARFIFDASDKTSGIDHYEVQIGNNDPEIWQDDGSHTYVAPVLNPGKYTLIAKAVDKAGNSLDGFADFTIEEPPPPPVITKYTKEPKSGEIIKFEGKTEYPGAQINFWLQHEKNPPKNYLLETGKGGEFIFAFNPRLSFGAYTAWAEAISSRGLKSDISGKAVIYVSQPEFLKIVYRYAGLFAAVIAFAALALAFLLYSWHKSKKKPGKISKEIIKTESSFRKQIKTLEKIRAKRQLTEKEEKIINRLRKDLNDAEGFIKKEIGDIGKE